MWRTYRNVLNSYPDATLSEKLLIITRFLELPVRDIDRWIGENDTIIELGCGRGVLANILVALSPGRSVYGVDLRAGRIARALTSLKENSRIEFHVANVVDPSLYHLQQKFDIVLVSELLYLLSPGDQETVLKKASDILIPGGRLVIKDYVTRPRYKYFLFWLETNFLHYVVNWTGRIAVKLGKLGRHLQKIQTMFGVRDAVTVLSRENISALLIEKGWSVLSSTLPSKGFWPHCLLVCERSGADRNEEQ
ncbi:MAG: class I SAM-dependent methyltransferase [Dehalococcoidia bacterium]|nr:class I SAM-dependent methyltransferase [Dehalococcoidia bacterium]